MHTSDFQHVLKLSLVWLFASLGNNLVCYRGGGSWCGTLGENDHPTQHEQDVDDVDDDYVSQLEISYLTSNV